MRRNRFSIYLVLQAIVIAAVMIIFKVIDDRKIAATVAGILFVSLPIELMVFEWLKFRGKWVVWYVATFQFWILFALPILGLRIFNWEADFSSLSILGVSGPFLHQWSSKSYMLWMLATLWTSWQVDKTKKAGL